MASLFVEKKADKALAPATTRVREPRGRWQTLRRVVYPVAGVLGFLALWEWAAAGPVHAIPLASDTLVEFGKLFTTGEFWTAAGETLGVAILGFVLASIVGVAIGLVIGLNTYAFKATRLPIEIVKPVPPIIILPIVVLLLGATQNMVLALVFWGLVPLTAVTAASGVRDVDPMMRETARSYRLGTFRRFRSLVLPTALPFIATGLRINASLAVIITVVGEIIGGAPGLGRMLEVYRQAGRPEVAFAYVIALGLIGVGVYFAIQALERTVLSWHESYRDSVKQQSRQPGEETLGERLTEAFWDSPLGMRLEDARVRRAERREVAGPRRRRNTLTTWPGRGLVLNVVQFGVPVALFAWWWIASEDSSSPFFPALREIAVRFQKLWLFDHFASDIVPSLTNFVGGFIVSVILGVAIGLIVARIDWLNRILDPLITFLRSIPAIAYVPVLIMIVGFGGEMRVVTIVLSAVFPILIATTDGVRGIDGTLNEVARTYRVSPLRRLTSIYLPAAAPRIFAGLEIALTMALVVMIASELIGTSYGIGAQVAEAQTYLEFGDMWAGILLLAIIGIACNLIFTVSRHFILSWYYGARAAARAE